MLNDGEYFVLLLTTFIQSSTFSILLDPQHGITTLHHKPTLTVSMVLPPVPRV